MLNKRMFRKKRILICNESHYLNTGYAVIGHELLRRLYDTEKYEIAEFATYGSFDDPRSKQCPWTFYPNMPDKNNEDEVKIYESKTSNQFGEWKFEETCLKFKPDYTIDIRDNWMFQYQIYSPFRPFYYHIIMPTVDAHPQSHMWINDFMMADKVFTYTNFGYETLKKQAGDKIKLGGAMSPGIDTNIFKPVENKKALKKSMGLDENALIVGTVMRNQKRKLFPDIFLSFAEFLNNAPSDLAKRTMLYCHTSFPDVGWDIPLLLKESGISHKVFFTYLCRACGFITAKKYSDVNIPCERCFNNTLCFTSPQFGVDRQTLAKIYNLFDVYLQYSVCEGFGVPIVEAASCGVPTMVVDYSGMEDFKDTLKSVPIKVQRFFREAETDRIMSLPDNTDFIEKLTKLLLSPGQVRQKLGQSGREGCKKYYNWNDMVAKLEKAIDELPLRDEKETWASPPRIYAPSKVDESTNSMSNEDFVRWAIINVAKEPKYLNTYIEYKMIKDLNFGQSYDYMGVPYFSDMSFLGIRPKLKAFNRNSCLEELYKLVDFRNHWEQVRMETLKK